MNVINIIFLFALFPSTVLSQLAKVDCEKDRIYKGIYSEKIEERKDVFKHCNIPHDLLNPVCKGKGLCKPIIVASAHNLSENVKLLIEAGAAINVRGGGRSGDTPLIYALMNDNKELVKFLVRKGADVNQANNFGATPFWGACMGNDIELVQLFINNGANINYGGRNPDPLREKQEIVTGITPLMLAAKNNNMALINVLLKHNAKTDSTDSLGRTANDYTTDKNIKQLLSTNKIPSKPVVTSKSTDVEQIIPMAVVEPTLDSDFFRAKDASYPSYIIEHADGHLESAFGDTISKKEAAKIEHTAKCFSSHQGKHLMSFSSAQQLDGGVLLEVTGGFPAYANSLSLHIGNDKSLKFTFAAVYPAYVQGERFSWEFTKQVFKMKSDNFTAGERLFGWLSVEFDEIRTFEGKITRTHHKIEGYVKPIIRKQSANQKAISEQVIPHNVDKPST